MAQETKDLDLARNVDAVVDFDGKKMLIVKAAVVETKPWRRGKQ